MNGMMPMKNIFYHLRGIQPMKQKSTQTESPKTCFALEDVIPLNLLEHARRLFLIISAAIIMSLNMNTFVKAGGLFPGGFNGLTLLIQRSADRFFGVALPFTLINFLLNAIPAIISYKFIGKRFTLYSCLMIILTSVLTDLFPSLPITDDILLICVFGGMINGFAISLCLWARATSGGTDFISVALSTHYNIDAWNYILYGNAVMLMVAGYLFGWDKALYSIIFQFASTQTIKLLDSRYKRTTLLIITEKTDEIYKNIIEETHHGATIFHGTGLYNGENRTMLYTVIAGYQERQVLKKVKEIDPHAFINVLKTEQVGGNFYNEPND
jgi:uncharacterized membrane-anchored protein YitT (DUF2179 family)